MKKIVLLAAALLAAAASFAQSEYNYQKRSLFEQLPIRGNDIVFLGNSITDGGEWAELFNNRHVKNRGISADPVSYTQLDVYKRQPQSIPSIPTTGR